MIKLQAYAACARLCYAVPICLRPCTQKPATNIYINTKHLCSVVCQTEFFKYIFKMLEKNKNKKEQY